jgi:hypothetical protein
VPVAGAAVTGTAAWEDPAADAWYDGYFRDEAATPAGTDEPAPGVLPGLDAPAHAVEPEVDQPAPGDVEGVPAAPQGRAARRRQRARWKKNQRKAVVATAVALVGGGLTVASMDRQAGDKAQAATAPENPHTAATEQQTEFTRPASAPADTHKAQRTPATASKPSLPDVAREPATSHTTRHITRPDAATAPRTAAAPEAHRLSPASGGTVSGESVSLGTVSGGTVSGGSNSGDTSGAAAEQQQAPQPTATEGTDTQTSPSQTSPAPEENSPAQLCVLNVLCVG